MVAEAQFQDNGDLILSFPYDRWVIDELEEEVPDYARQCSPDWRHWTIQGWMADIALAIASYRFPDIRIDRHTPAPKSRRRPTDSGPLRRLPIGELVRLAMIVGADQVDADRRLRAGIPSLAELRAELVRREHGVEVGR